MTSKNCSKSNEIKFPDISFRDEGFLDLKARPVGSPVGCTVSVRLGVRPASGRRSSGVRWRSPGAVPVGEQAVRARIIPL